MSWLAKGITWAPSYLVDISTPDKARFTAKAEVINEAADLPGVDLALVTGYPHLQFADVLSPLAMKRDLATFLRDLAAGSSGQERQGQVMSNMMTQQVAYAYSGPAAPALPSFEANVPGAAAEDLFLYPLPKVDLAKGQTGYYPLLDAAVPYEHVHLWDIPDYLNDQEQYDQRRQQQPDESVVWHALRLTNTTAIPWTTAPAETVTGGQVLGQDVIPYTPAGGKATLKITVAVDVKADQAEFERERQRDALNFQGWQYDRVTVDGKLSVHNLKQSKVTVEVTKLLSGDVQSSKPEAAAEKLARGLRAVNPLNRLRWTLTLSPARSNRSPIATRCSSGGEGATGGGGALRPLDGTGRVPDNALGATPFSTAKGRHLMSSDFQTTEPPAQPPPPPPPVGPRTVTYRQPARGASRWVIGCLAFAVGGIAVMLLLGVVLVVGVFATVFGGTGLTTEASPEAAIREVTVGGQDGAPKVAVIPVTGTLMPGGGGTFGGADPRALFEAMLKKARRDGNVCAVILAVDSGGGAITTCDIMYKDLQDFRTDSHKPVVVLMGDVAASGAYYLSCAADYVMAHPTTITGSIGVMMPLYSASDLLEKVGVKDETITTGPYKDIGSLTAAKTPEEWARDRKLLSGVMNQMYDRFVTVVAEGRGLKKDVVITLADGRIYSSQEAKADKLIDSIGYMSDAEAKVRELTGLAPCTWWSTSARRRWRRSCSA